MAELRKIAESSHATFQKIIKMSFDYFRRQVIYQVILVTKDALILGSHLLYGKSLFKNYRGTDYCVGDTLLENCSSLQRFKFTLI